MKLDGRMGAWMGEFYLGEVRAFGFGKAPKGWAVCDGSILQIGQNTALFSLIGTTYGGDGVTTFGLPDLRSRAIVGQGQAGSEVFVMGQQDGVENVTIDASTLPAHNHLIPAYSQRGRNAKPTGGYAATVSPDNLNPPQNRPRYGAPTAAATTLDPGSIDLAGGAGSHPNLQPYQAVNYCIATAGVYPSRS